MRETIQRKLRTVEDHKADVEQSKELLKGNITALERGNKEVLRITLSDVLRF